MSTPVILATADAGLADAWERQLPPGRTVLRCGPEGLAAGLPAGLAAVVILDVASEASLPAALARCPTILVGEPRSLPFEQARLAGRARAYLAYDEGGARFAELVPLLEELAEQQAMVELLAGKARRAEAPRPPPRPAAADLPEWWDFLEGAVENLEGRDRLLGEFRRAFRFLLRASHTVFFLREPAGFRADRGTSFFPADDPLVAFFEAQPTVIDDVAGPGAADPAAELAVRNRLALWGARLLVPVHDRGRLLGLIALGVREDGQPYDEADRQRAVYGARLLRQFLARSAQVGRLVDLAERQTLGAKYLPGTLVLAADEPVPRHLPLVVRDLLGQARRRRETCRVAPTPHQPFRAAAGVVAETGGVWAFWEEASAEVGDAIGRERGARRELLRELALTLSHELGNALVTLTTFRQSTPERPLPPALLETVKRSVSDLEALGDHLAVLQGLHEAEAAPADVREVAQYVGHGLGLRVEAGPDPVVLAVSRKLLEFALRSLVRTIGENRGDQGLRDVVLKVRSTGAGPELTALLSLRGKPLELEGILPEPAEGGVPNQGRLAVFLAKEILRLHGGEIHAGPGLEGTEILISFRAW